MKNDLLAGFELLNIGTHLTCISVRTWYNPAKGCSTELMSQRLHHVSTLNHLRTAPVQF